MSDPRQIELESPLASLPREARPFFDQLLEKPLHPPARVAEHVRTYLENLDLLSKREEFLDVTTARAVAERCCALLDRVDDATPEGHRRLIQAAALYFTLDHDADSDLDSPVGFDDDLRVVEAVETLVGSSLGASSSSPADPSPDADSP